MPTPDVIENSPFPSEPGVIAAGATFEPGTPARLEATTSVAYMNLHFGQPAADWPVDGSPFVEARLALERQREGWAKIVETYRRELSGNGIDSRERRLLNAVRAARKELDAAGVRAAIAHREVEAELKRLDQQLAELPAQPPEGAEIRRYIAALPDGRARERFIEQAIEDGDAETVAAALGAKTYLSGLTVDQAARLRERWQERAMPEVVARRAAVLRAQEAVTKARLALEQHVAERLEAQLSAAARQALEAAA